MKFVRFAASFVFVCLFVALACVGGCAPSDCKVTADCKAGEVCQQGTCQAQVSDAGEVPVGVDAAPTEASSQDRAVCLPGALGCRCTPTGGCDTGMRCTNGTCQVCVEGTAGCGCKSDGSCSGALRCESGVCRGCVGKERCSCYGNNSCDVGLRCKISTTTYSTCELCKGNDKVDCNCATDADCAGLACVNRRCIDLSKVNSIPQNPVCYMPCEETIQKQDGTLLDCDPRYKLAKGCPAGQSCREGSCVDSDATKLASSAYPFCQVDSDCMKWQACLHGRCYSTCQTNAQCQSGFSCFYYVCRRKCNVRKDQCQQWESCQTSGADDGVCMPKSPGFDPKPKQTSTPGTFKIATVSLEFSATNTTQIIVLTNKSNVPSSFALTRTRDSLGTAKPLFWLKFDLCKTYNANRDTCTAFEGRPSSAETFVLKDVQPNQPLIIQVSNAQGKPKATSAYNGVLTLRSQTLGKQDISVLFRDSATGQWKGQMISFGNFNDDKIGLFPANNTTEIRSIPNALLQLWLNLKRNQITFAQFSAALRSIREGTWTLKKVQQDCKTLFSTQASEDVVCYPFNNKKGYEILSFSQRQAPVPSAPSELTFAVNVKESNGDRLEGRIDSTQTLHYPGHPWISFEFTKALKSARFVPIKSFGSTIDMGGRYQPTTGQGCAAGSYRQASFPWLVPGFALGSEPAPGSLFRQRSTCRMADVPLPIPSNATAEQRNAIQQNNMSLSSANPIPNGWRLRRKLELVDGALIDNQYLFVLYRERFASFFQSSSAQNTLGNDFVSYGYMLLIRSPQTLQASDYVGSQPVPLANCSKTEDCQGTKVCQAGVCREPNKLNQVQCSPDVIRKALNINVQNDKALTNWSSSLLNDLVSVLLTGQTAKNANDSATQYLEETNNNEIEYTFTANGTKHYIHYLCEDTGQFDGGPADNPQTCVGGSKVTFFSLAGVTTDALRADPCQQTKTCVARFNQLRNSSSGFIENVPHQCKGNSQQLFCDDPADLRKGKLFFRTGIPGTFVSSYSSLRNAIFQAFRYRLKFVSRSGKNIGFTPDICQGTASLTPYCYDPKAIESIEQRVNCLESIFSNGTLTTRLSPTMLSQLKAFLTFAFSYQNRNVNGTILTDFGFETLNAELKVMLGDEAYTRSFSSRYDLANSKQIAFDGGQFEPNGIKLSGALGYEMHNLYLSTQYYQMVLDRLFSQASVLRRSFASPDTSFMTAASVTSYFQKLLLASTRKARSYSQIARRYHQLNRADLAGHVLNRAYAGTYMEMIVLTRLLNELIRILDRKQIPQIASEIDKLTLTYKASLLDMEETYKNLRLAINFFGLPPNYIPFPALDRFSALTSTTNAFQFALTFAKEKLLIARTKEQAAIQSKRSFDTNAASFQNELVRIERNYESQLSDICGQISVTGANGEVRQFPAIPKYAALSAQTRGMDAPCGSVPGSALYEALLGIEKIQLTILSIKKSQENVLQQIRLERDRIQKYCDAKFSLARITFDERNKQNNLQLRIEDIQRNIDRTTRIAQQATQAAEQVKCSWIVGTANGGDCPTAWVSIAMIAAIGIAQEIAVTVQEEQLKKKREELLKSERYLEKTQIQFECRPCDARQQVCTQKGTAQIESDIKLKQLAGTLLNLEYESQKALLDLRIAWAGIKRLQQQAHSLITRQNEATQLAINVQAAQNDPNVRIYKNDAILSAERTFHDAIREAYRATLIYEYYTGTSYAAKNDLFLIRLVSYGDKNLESYLSQLEQAFRDFEEQNSKPDIRVVVLSLRDDIMKIPRTGSTPKGQPARIIQDRTNEFRRRLADRVNLNSEGYSTFPFQLSVNKKDSLVSPVTFNHKVLYIEAEIVGSDLGDAVGRIYLQQKGTGVVRLKRDEYKYYVLPVRTAVINPFFNGAKVFNTEVYRNFRLRDRPLGNTQWEIQLNQVTEKVNQDINLNRVDDIRLYIYYTDFTEE